MAIELDTPEAAGPIRVQVYANEDVRVRSLSAPVGVRIAVAPGPPGAAGETGPQGPQGAQGNPGITILPENTPINGGFY